jgi:hypothetical protein
MADSDKCKHEDDGEAPTLPNKRFQKSAFEREKEEREAKEQQEELARQRVLEEFRQEHGDDGNDDGTNVPAPSSGRRHFTGNSALKSKAELEAQKRGEQVAHPKRRPLSKIVTHKVYQEYTEDGSRHALHLTPLPVGTSEDEVFTVVNDFVTDELRIDEIFIGDHTKLPKWTLGYMGRSLPFDYVSALVVFASDTRLETVKSAEEELHGKYLGKGIYVKVRTTTENESLSLDSIPSQEQEFPFGATPINRPTTTHHPFAKPPPPSLQGISTGYQSYSRAPPPPSYGAPPVTQIPSYPDDYEVVVEYPEDLDEIRIIHSTVEKVLTVGPEVEETLMSQEDVQKDETWAWLWDGTSVAGRYYRWRLWEQSLPPEDIRERNIIFAGEAPWKKPKQSLPFEFCTSLDEMANDPGFMNIKSDEGIEEILKDDSEELEQLLQAQNGDFEFLGPYLASELQYHLDNLPNNPVNLIEKDLKFPVVFALDYAGKATKEIAERLISQLEAAYNRALDSLVPKSIKEFADAAKRNTMSETPEVGMVDATHTVQLVGISGLSYIAPLLEEPANIARGADARSSTVSGAVIADVTPEDYPEEASSMVPSFAPYEDDYDSMDYDEDYEPEVKPERERWPYAKPLEDPSGPILVALYVLTDVMAQAKDEGDYKKMRYAVEFEEILKSSGIFSKLGCLDREFGWGKMRADRWRTKVTDIFDQWESSNLMKKEAIEQFRDEFNNPLNADEEQEELNAVQETNAAANAEPTRPRFKPIGQAAEVHLDTKPVNMEAVEGKPIEAEDIDGKPTNAKRGIDGEPMSEEEEIDGQPATDSDEEFPMTKNGTMMNNDKMDVDGDATNAKKDREGIDGVPMSDDDNTDGTPFTPSDDEAEEIVNKSNENGAGAAVHAAVLGEAGVSPVTSQQHGDGPLSTVGTVSGQAPAGSAAQPEVLKRPISFALKGAAKPKAVKPKALGGSDSEASDKE